MARTGVSYEEVKQVANELMEEGINPTIDRVRLELGTGSNSTIAEHLRLWKKERMAFAYHQVGHNKKMGLPGSLEEMVAQLWEKLRMESQAENERIQSEAQEAITQAQLAQSEAEQDAANLRENLEKAKLRINHLEVDDQLRRAELIELYKQKAILEERVKAGENALATFQVEAQKHLEKQQQHFQETNAYLKNELEVSRQKAHGEIEELRGQLEDQRQKFMVEKDHLQTAKDTAEKAATKLDAELKNETNYRKLAQEETRGLQLDLKIAQQRLGEHEKLLANLSGESVYKDREIEGLNRQLQDTQQRLSEAIQVMRSLPRVKKRKNED